MSAHNRDASYSKSQLLLCPVEISPSSPAPPSPRPEACRGVEGCRGRHPPTPLGKPLRGFPQSTGHDGGGRYIQPQTRSQNQSQNPTEHQPGRGNINRGVAP